MGWFRIPGRIFGRLGLVGLLLPVLAVGISAFLDRGPDGETRASAFPIALVLSDPYLWTSTIHSLGIASIIALGSLWLGVGLGLILEGPRFRARKLLGWLALSPIAAGPLVLAPGLASMVGGPGSWDWLASRSLLGSPMDEAVRWVLLAWVGLATGVPIVALSTASVLRRIEPAWSDAARAAGASRARVWREIVWPIVRPEASRATAIVFGLALVEPAAPRFLGLRRTLGFQLLDEIARFDQPTRAAILALSAMVLAVLARTLLNWWGGPRLSCPETYHVHQPPRASLRRGLLSTLALLAWVGLSLGPILALVFPLTKVAGAASPRDWTSIVRPWIEDPSASTWLVNSATAAGLALLLDLAILGALAGRGRRLARFASDVFEVVPPLALAVGALTIPWLIGGLGDWSGGSIGGVCHWTSRELSPGRSPGFLLVMVLAAGRWPMLGRVAGLARDLARPYRVDASRLMGASDRSAMRAGGVGAVPVRHAVLAFTIGATNLVPALALTPFSERRTLAPSLFAMVLDRSTLPPHVLGGLLAIFGVNLIAFAWAARSRVGSPGEWFRG